MATKELQKIKELRERLSISIKSAKELINENNGDLLVCVQEFHKHNINIICRLAECNEQIAEKYYKICNFNIDKSIQKIHEQLFYLTTTPNTPISKIGFILWAENKSLDKYVSSRDKSLFIPTIDFEYVLGAFTSVFPLKDEKGNIVEDCFCPVSHNIFNNKTSRIIVNGIATIKTKDPYVEKFLRDLIKWLNIQLKFAEEIVVYGNL